ncbi:MAG TPA: hypothetical protein VIL95_08945, partial [Bacillota bacterium]
MQRFRSQLVLACVLALLVAACGQPAFDAKGLVFSYPDGFRQAEGTNRQTLVLRADGDAAQGVLALHWSENDQPDARPVIDAALTASGVEASQYNRIRLERIDTAEVDGLPADYLELVVENDVDPAAPSFFSRLLLFSGPDGTQYILGHVTAVDHREDSIA